MKQFVRRHRYPRLDKFTANNIELVRSFVVRYENVLDARLNLFCRFNPTYRNVRPYRRRGPSLVVDIMDIYIEVRGRRFLEGGTWRAVEVFKSSII